MKFTDENGNEWEPASGPVPPHEQVWVIRRVPKRHTFGQIVFEETGEVRRPVAGEWFLGDVMKSPIFARSGDGSQHLRILRPVAIEEQTR